MSTKLSDTMQAEYDYYLSPEDPAWLTPRHIEAVRQLEDLLKFAEADLATARAELQAQQVLFDEHLQYSEKECVKLGKLYELEWARENLTFEGSDREALVDRRIKAIKDAK